MKGLRTSAVLAVLLACVVASSALAQPKEVPPEMTGIKVGEKAPDFTLQSHDGKEYVLSDLVKKGKVAVVFFRSANW